MRKRRISFVVIIGLFLFLTFFQLPYYVTTPGQALVLSPIIEVEGGYDEEEGSFMLTTVQVGKANVVQYAFAKLNEYHYIYTEDDLRPHGETDEEYHERQLHYMESSQEAAQYVAYSYADKDVQLESKGVYVLDIIDGMPAKNTLKVGDQITSVDKMEITSGNELIKYVSSMGAGDKIELSIIRRDEKQTIEVALGKFPEEIYDDKVGLGIRLVTNNEVIVNPPVFIDTDKIGGPSAGLMFTLEIYNQLIEEDLTKGHEIAGTGTIDYDGLVGPIGGIQQKIVAAHKSGASIFFAPNEDGIPDSNYAQALEAAKDIGTSMEIVPVDTFEDAVEYLHTLPSNHK